MTWGTLKINNCSFVEVVNVSIYSIRIMIHNIYTSIKVLDIPFVVSKCHVDNICWIFTCLFVFGNQNLSYRHNSIINSFFGFCLVNFSNSPPFNPPISSSSQKIISILNNYLKPTVMKWFMRFYFKHKMRFDKLTLPHNQSSICSS